MICRETGALFGLIIFHAPSLAAKKKVWRNSPTLFPDWSKSKGRQKLKSALILGLNFGGSRYILGMATSQDSSDHLGFYMFSRDSQPKPFLSTVAGRGQCHTQNI